MPGESGAPTIRFPGGDEAVQPYVEQVMGVKAGEKHNTPKSPHRVHMRKGGSSSDAELTREADNIDSALSKLPKTKYVGRARSKIARAKTALKTGGARLEAVQNIDSAREILGSLNR